MKKTNFLAAFALMLGLSVPAFAGDETKTKESATPATVETAKPEASQAQINLYWYDADSGAELSGNPSAEPQNSECTNMSDNCALGFSEPTDQPLVDHPTATRGKD